MFVKQMQGHIFLYDCMTLIKNWTDVRCCTDVRHVLVVLCAVKVLVYWSYWPILIFEVLSERLPLHKVCVWCWKGPKVTAGALCCSPCRHSKDNGVSRALSVLFSAPATTSRCLQSGFAVIESRKLCYKSTHSRQLPAARERTTFFFFFTNSLSKGKCLWRKWTRGVCDPRDLFFHQGQWSDWDAALCGEIKPRHHGNIMCKQDDQGHMGERWLLYYIARWLLSNGRRKVYLCQLPFMFSCLSQLLINAWIEVKHQECACVCVFYVCLCVPFHASSPGH